MEGIREGLFYTEEHEWVRREDDGEVTVGITAHAQDALGEVVFVELPGVGESYEAGDDFGVVESVKAAGDCFAPVAGTITAVNERLSDEPELVNKSPYEDGWLVRMALEDEEVLDSLMSAEQYEVFLEKG